MYGVLATEFLKRNFYGVRTGMFSKFFIQKSFAFLDFPKVDKCFIGM